MGREIFLSDIRGRGRARRRGCGWQEDVEILSDDRIIVRRDFAEAGVEIPPEAADGASGHEVLRLRDCSASPNGPFAQDNKLK